MNPFPQKTWWIASATALIFLQELLPLPSQAYARLLLIAQRETVVGDLLRQAPGQFVDLGEDRKVAYIGPLGDGHLRAYTQAFDEGVEWGVEVVDAPGEVYGLVLLHGTRIHPQEAEAEAIKRAKKVYQFFTLEAQGVPF
ncbi:hypothetical protein [Thermus caldilimi]|uniref:hypothetical protein n=1 Tax=Thermus caldilimi TaxID=2483360 RepID=UPI00107697A1|nr:hypothetical protein [Thermus caldilimi]